MQPQVTVQSTGPVRVIVATEGPVGVHVPPRSEVVIAPAKMAPLTVSTSAQFAAWAAQAAADGMTLAEFAEQAWRRASPSEARWAAQRAEAGDTLWRFAGWACQRAGRRQGGAPNQAPRGLNLCVTVDPAELGCAVGQRETITARFRSVEALRFRELRRGRGGRRNWRGRREPARGTPAYAAEVARLDAQLDEYMAGGREAWPPPI